MDGADNLVVGVYSMIDGEEIPSLIQGGFRHTILNRTATDLAGFEITLNVDGLAVERTAIRTAQAGGSGVGTASDIADDLATQGSGSTALLPRSSKSLGKWGEARPAQVVGGAGYKPEKAFHTSRGLRYIDRLVRGIVHESKAAIN